MTRSHEATGARHGPTTTKLRPVREGEVPPSRPGTVRDRIAPAPKDLGRRGRAAWRDLAEPLHVYSLDDRAMLDRLLTYCRSLDDEDRYRAEVEAQGVTVRGSRGVVANPAVKASRDAAVLSASLRRELEAYLEAASS
jgi:phage terminase small subunit